MEGTAGTARQGRRGEACVGSSRRGRLGPVGQCVARHRVARLGRSGWVRQGSARRGTARRSTAGQASLGAAWSTWHSVGLASHGLARQAWPHLASLALASHGWAGMVWTGVARPGAPGITWRGEAGVARPDTVVVGEVRHGSAGMDRPGMTRHGSASGWLVLASRGRHGPERSVRHGTRLAGLGKSWQAGWGVSRPGLPRARCGPAGVEWLGPVSPGGLPVRQGLAGEARHRWLGPARQAGLVMVRLDPARLGAEGAAWQAGQLGARLRTARRGRHGMVDSCLGPSRSGVSGQVQAGQSGRGPGGAGHVPLWRGRFGPVRSSRWGFARFGLAGKARSSGHVIGPACGWRGAAGSARGWLGIARQGRARQARFGSSGWALASRG